MDNTVRVFSGRTFSSEDIDTIKWTLKTYPKLSRTEVVGTVCEMLNWVTPGGMAKRVQCTKFMEELEKEGIIELPEKDSRRIRKKADVIEEFDFDTSEVIGEVTRIEPIALEIAYSGKNLNRWKAYVNKYHKLGFKTVFGSRLQYFIKSGDRELGCLQFSASSWALKARDEWIGWSIEDKKQRLNLILNNSRFLIFPWVNVKNLASKALSMAINQIQEDWVTEYCYEPVALETFVDTSCYQGTCYKASNWIYLGDTIGSGRTGKKDTLSKKKIFMYPLEKDFREYLKGNREFKKTSPK